MADARLDLAERLGFHRRYHDQTGVAHDLGVESAVALLAALGQPAATEAEARERLAEGDDDLPWDVVFAAGTRPWVDIGEVPWELTREDGERIEGRGAASLPELPLGIHRLVAGGRRVTLLAAPPRLALPERAWGLIAPLYALSEKGIGSYGDLARLARALGPKDAAFLGINPVHAGFPTVPEHFSPYSPSHRRRLNVIHIPTPTGQPGALVEYPRETPERLHALRRAFEADRAPPAFEAFLEAEGPALRTFALHQALSQIHGAFWCGWPEALRSPGGTEAARAREELGEEIRFHAWMQWRAHEALSEAQAAAKAAGMAHGLYLDLAVGTHPHGAETWEDPEHFALDVSLGAPPDAFAADGQTWGLAPFNPRALRENSYAALAETLARQFRYAGILRIDHILGFERTFWVPDGAPGTYLTMPRDPMLAVARIEAARAGGLVIGEDLGNIPDGLREALAASGILGCRVAMFERSDWHAPVFKPAAAYDEAAIASFSTHDLPTWRGWRKGADITARMTADNLDAAQGEAALASRTREVAAFDALLPETDEDALHGFLAATPTRLVGVQAEIVLEMEDQQNLPGTTTEYPNWRIRLPQGVETMSDMGNMERVAQIMRRNDRVGRGQQV
ncbi:4-alpha-glucanotransferase [Celeribacter indicus]|uniref:4-alpha-glucanotransferase n=1 Tax=Celeribacter indicus TaxID=1208324 RepID=A0A0B5DWJ4_9RHOB|nr:4-alpha-glucanotransferase [Celeribacter indicus]AJE47778.1 4-alpha-glucanotransferase [Celeribacter indicus]SDW22574.1 4-alpha-glucanotransferase [Celeribacter indicus]